jgi:hypothetical protein
VNAERAAQTSGGVGPFERLVSRLEDVRRGSRETNATCPACQKRRKLYIRTISDGTVVVKCFHGCSMHEVVESVGLQPRDLFPETFHAPPARAMRVVSAQVVHEALERELQRILAEEARSAGTDVLPPARAAHINRARARVSSIYGVELPPVASALWESPPHDVDPLWPALFAHYADNALLAIGETVLCEERERKGLGIPVRVRITAENRAAAELRAMATSGRSA